jgi:hypothetical protein
MGNEIFGKQERWKTKLVFGRINPRYNGVGYLLQAEHLQDQ